jgi:flagellar biosynthesis protein FlhA
MGKEFAQHLFKNPNPMYIGSFIILLLGLVPGLPAFPFLTLAILLGTTTYFLQKRGLRTEEAAPSGAEAAAAAEDAEPEAVEHLLTLDTMELEVGYGLIPLVDREQDGTLLGRIRAIRRQFATEMGIIIPPIHIRDNLKLKPPEYRLLIKGVEMAGSELVINHLLAMDPGTVTREIEGIPTTEPAFNLPAMWIPPEKEEDAKFSGYTVVDNATVIATHLTEIIRNNSPELLGRQEVQHLLDNLASTHPKAVEELVPALLPLGIVQKVLQNLLRERVSIRDLLSIVETLADYAPMSKDSDLLTEYVRQRLARSIIGPLLQDDGVLQVITVDQNIEDTFSKGIQHSEHGSYLTVEPKIVESVIASMKEQVEKIIESNLQPIILCSPVLRRHIRKIVEQFAPSVFVFSHAEILQNIRIQAAGKVAI